MKPWSWWRSGVLALTAMLLPTADLAAQSILSGREAEISLTLPKRALEDDLQGSWIKFARGSHHMFAALRHIVSRLTPLPQDEGFKADVTSLRTQVRRFRANYIDFVCAERRGDFGHAVFLAADLFFVGTDAWQAEVEANEVLEGATGSLEPLRARIARDAAAQRRVANWKGAQQLMQYALVAQPSALAQLKLAEDGAEKQPRSFQPSTRGQEQGQRQPSGFWLYAATEEDEHCGAPSDSSRMTWKGGFPSQGTCDAVGAQMASRYECRAVYVSGTTALTAPPAVRWFVQDDVALLRRRTFIGVSP